MRALIRSRIIVCFVFVLGVLGADTIARAQQGSSGLVVAESDLATKAGMEILNRGGNAVDAAIATAFAASVVDQAASGLGGGGLMVIYEAKEHKSHALDFRETAPEGARAELYSKGGKSVPSLSLTGGLAVAVPGEVAGLLQAHKRFGSLPLPVLLASAIRLATEGFPISATLRYAIERQSNSMKRFPDLGRVFMPNGELPAIGDLIRQADLGETLKAIASQGAEVFYQGWIAAAIVEAVKKEGGVLSLDDLKNYKPIWREPLIGAYRQRTVITMPPPSSGGITILQMLNVLEGYEIKSLGHNSATYLHLVTETLKHAYAARAQYLGDPDFVKAPVSMLISKEHAAWIRGRITPSKTHPVKYYGSVNFKAEQGGTAHISVIDRFGNAVACTQTVNGTFGSKVLAAKTGIVLNNEIDDFAIHASGNSAGLVGNDANSLQPKKRPLSSMSPTIVLRGDRPELVVGAGTGGPRIISATLQAMLNILDFNMPVREAVEAPRIHHQWVPEDLIVESKIPVETKTSLEKRGHSVKERNVFAVVQAITWDGSTMSGAADPRKVERARTE